MKNVGFFTLLLALLISACNSDDMLEKENTSKLELVSVGEYHNLVLDDIVKHLNIQTTTRSAGNDPITVETYSQKIADVQIEILKHLDRSTMTKEQVDQFVQRTLDISLDPSLLQTVNNLFENNNYSFTEDLKRKYPGQVTSTVTNYLNEMKNVFATQLNQTAFENEVNKVHLKWYRQANVEDRQLISSATSVALSSMDYWNKNAKVWNPQISTWISSRAKSVITSVAYADFIAAADCVYIARQFSVVFWKEIALYSAAISAKAGIGAIVCGFLSSLWTVDNKGNAILSLPNQTPVTANQFKEMVYSEYLKRNAE